MFEDRSYKRTFYSAPQSVTSLVAAFMEPAITVLIFVIASWWYDEPIVRADLTLCLLVFALTFPGRNRFKDKHLSVAVDIATSWVVLLAILLLCGYATRSFGFFNESVLLAWVIATPVVQFLAVWLGQVVLRRHATRPEARRSAIVIGAAALGVKVARALKLNEDQGSDFIGYFDDRTDERVHKDAQPHIRGGLKDVAAFIRERGVKEVYITLHWARSRASSSCLSPCKAPPRRCSSCPTCSASASSRAACRT